MPSVPDGPRVSIGLPVYDGQNFLEPAIRSLLDQTYRDFELIISDNASTDRTPEICRAHAERDARVRYSRNATNIGAAPNYNRVFEQARGRYFKWAAHDDVCRPDFLRRCVQALESDPGAVLAFTRTATIDERDQVIKEWEARPAFAAGSPQQRFREALRPRETHPIWGLMRVEVLRRTPLFGSYPGHDLPLLAELALLGRFHEIPEVLFLQREHRGRSVRRYDFRNPHRAVVWYDPSKAGRLIFPRWRLLAEYAAAIRRAPLRAGERLRCWRELLPWLRGSAAALLGDLIWAMGRIPGLGKPMRAGYRRVVHALEQARLRRVARGIRAVTDDRDVVLLVGDCWFESEKFLRRKTLPFLERGGRYFGAPADDETAIRELERMRREGATHMVFAWPSFWWLDHYTKLGEYLRSHFHTVLEDRRVVAFELHAPRS